MEILVPLTPQEKIRIDAAIAELAVLLRIDRRRLEEAVGKLMEERL